MSRLYLPRMVSAMIGPTSMFMKLIVLRTEAEAGSEEVDANSSQLLPLPAPSELGGLSWDAARNGRQLGL